MRNLNEETLLMLERVQDNGQALKKGIKKQERIIKRIDKKLKNFFKNLLTLNQ